MRPPEHLKSLANRAEGTLLAAVHNAHWFQPQPVVEYFCSRTLTLSPHAADMMAWFIDNLPGAFNQARQNFKRASADLDH